MKTAEEKLIRDFKRIDGWSSKRLSALYMNKKGLAESARIEQEAEQKKLDALKEYASQRSTLSHGKVMKVLNRQLGHLFEEGGEKISDICTSICQLAPEKQVSEVPDDIREYIGKAMYDDHGQLIFRGTDKDNLKQFLDVRGWGAIQNMTFESTKEAEAFQDKIGQWVTDVINDKLQSPEPKEPSQWISVENALPTLAPTIECYKDKPFSITVWVRFSQNQECEAMYDFNHREWLDPGYEFDLEKEFDCRVVSWKSAPEQEEGGKL